MVLQYLQIIMQMGQMSQFFMLTLAFVDSINYSLLTFKYSTTLGNNNIKPDPILSMKQVVQQAGGEGSVKHKMFSISDLASALYKNEVLDFKTIVSLYQEMETLVVCYNQIFRSLIFIFKTIAVIQLCIYVYVPIRRTDFLPVKVTFGSLLIFLVLTLFFTIQVCLMIVPMGTIRARSQQIKRLLKSKLLKMSPYLKRTEVVDMKRGFSNCYQLGFESGWFYIIDKGTILTFFSIAASYLIILLQLD